MTEKETITRKLYFYQIKYYDENDNIKTISDELFNELMNKICNTNKEDNYSLEKHTKANEKNWFFGVLAKINKKDYPLKQNLINKNVEGLNLEEDEALYLPSHFGIYKNQLLISERVLQCYYPSTKIQQLINKYLTNKKNNEDIKYITITPIASDNLIEILNETKYLRGLTISLASNYKERLNNDGLIIGMFNDIKKFPGINLTLDINIGLKRKKKAYEQMLPILNDLKQLVKLEEFLESCQILRINRYKNGKSETKNLLNHLFYVEEEIIKLNNKTKAVDETDMFKKIKLGYENNSIYLKEYIKE